MVVIEVRFDGNSKVYQYLFVNPNKFKMDRAKALVYSYGMSTAGAMTKNLTAVSAYKVDELPPIVTSQIILLDDNNHIDIQKIGAINVLPKKEGSTASTVPKKTRRKTTVSTKPSTVYVDISKHLKKIQEEYERKQIMAKAYKKYT